VARLHVRLSAEWLDYFRANAENLLDIPWGDGAGVTPEELAAIASSVREFQLGESSDGRRGLAIARAYAGRCGDHLYPDAVAALFSEEHRHAAALGRFLELAGEPLLAHSWGDIVFRQLRRAFNLELLIAVLLTVELIAKVYYRALHDATRSPLLRRICAQILRDEKPHVQFHFERFALMRRFRPRWLITVCHGLQRFLFAGTCFVVWRNHRRALCAGGYGWRRWCRACRHEMNEAIRQMDPANYDFACDSAASAFPFGSGLPADGSGLRLPGMRTRHDANCIREC
jgi:hypothetical protein